nr:PREDICTED: golgin subfamily A member 6-like protein 22 [Megachile rotundata]
MKMEESKEKKGASWDSGKSPAKEESHEWSSGEKEWRAGEKEWPAEKKKIELKEQESKKEMEEKMKSKEIKIEESKEKIGASWDSGSWKEESREWSSSEEEWKEGDKGWSSGEKGWKEGDKEWSSGETDWKKGDKEWSSEEKEWKESDKEWSSSEKEWNAGGKSWSSEKKNIGMKEEEHTNIKKSEDVELTAKDVLLKKHGSSIGKPIAEDSIVRYLNERPALLHATGLNNAWSKGIPVESDTVHGAHKSDVMSPKPWSSGPDKIKSPLLKKGTHVSENEWSDKKDNLKSHIGLVDKVETQVPNPLIKTHPPTTLHTGLIDGHLDSDKGSWKEESNEWSNENWSSLDATKEATALGKKSKVATSSNSKEVIRANNEKSIKIEKEERKESSKSEEIKISNNEDTEKWRPISNKFRKPSTKIENKGGPSGSWESAESQSDEKETSESSESLGHTKSDNAAENKNWNTVLYRMLESVLSIARPWEHEANVIEDKSKAWDSKMKTKTATDLSKKSQKLDIFVVKQAGNGPVRVAAVSDRKPSSITKLLVPKKTYKETIRAYRKYIIKDGIA